MFAESATAITSELSGRVLLLPRRAARPNTQHGPIEMPILSTTGIRSGCFVSTFLVYVLYSVFELFIHPYVLYLLKESSTAVCSPIPGQQQNELETVPPLKRKRGRPPKASKDTTSASKKSNSSSIHSQGDILSILILTYCNT